MEQKIKSAYNRCLDQWQVKWLIEHSTSYQLLWLNKSFMLRNPTLSQVTNHYV